MIVGKSGAETSCVIMNETDSECVGSWGIIRRLCSTILIPTLLPTLCYSLVVRRGLGRLSVPPPLMA